MDTSNVIILGAAAGVLLANPEVIDSAIDAVTQDGENNLQAQSPPPFELADSPEPSNNGVSFSLLEGESVDQFALRTGIPRDAIPVNVRAGGTIRFVETTSPVGDSVGSENEEPSMEAARRGFSGFVATSSSVDVPKDPVEQKSALLESYRNRDSAPKQLAGDDLLVKAKDIFVDGLSYWGDVIKGLLDKTDIDEGVFSRLPTIPISTDYLPPSATTEYPHSTLPSTRNLIDISPDGNVHIDRLVEDVKLRMEHAESNYVYLDPPSVVDGSVDYQISPGTCRNEIRGYPEQIALFYYLVDVFNSNKSAFGFPNAVLEAGDIYSTVHIEHDDDRPAIDIRSLIYNDDGNTTSGPVFMENSSAYDPEFTAFMYAELRKLRYEGQPLVNYIITDTSGLPDSIHSLERLSQEGELIENKQFLLDRSDHGDHTHVSTFVFYPGDSLSTPESSSCSASEQVQVVESEDAVPTESHNHDDSPYLQAVMGNSGTTANSLSMETAPYTIEDWAYHTLTETARSRGIDPNKVMTADRIHSLVAWAIAEGGGIDHNADGHIVGTFNPLNTKGGDELGGVNEGNAELDENSNGFPNFATGVLASAQSICDNPNQTRICDALLAPQFSQQQFINAVAGQFSFSNGDVINHMGGIYSDNKPWAMASVDGVFLPSTGEYASRSQFVQTLTNVLINVDADYGRYAGRVLGSTGELANTSDLRFINAGVFSVAQSLTTPELPDETPASRVIMTEADYVYYEQRARDLGFSSVAEYFATVHETV